MGESARGGREAKRGRLARAVAIVAAVFTLSVVPIVFTPAQACACGGILLGEGESAAVQAERAILSWDGETEQIVLSMGVDSSAPAMALLIPTPAPATVGFADPGVFEELGRFTAPTVNVEKSWWPSSAPGAGSIFEPAVEVLERIELDGFTAHVLAATDADRLAQWLDHNGYVMRDDIASALTPYVQQKWYFVAIALDGTEFSGELDPLSISFPAKQLVYPMRMSAAGKGSLSVRTYVFARHRMERVDPMGGQVLWAGAVRPTDFVNDTLVKLAADHEFLTLWHQDFDYPAQIVSDMVFAAASTDTPTSETVVVTQTRTIGGLPAGWVLVGAGVVAGGLTTWWILRRRVAAGDPHPDRSCGGVPVIEPARGDARPAERL